MQKKLGFSHWLGHCSSTWSIEEHHKAKAKQEGVRGKAQHTQRVSSLQHESLDDPVEDDTIIVAIPGVGGPVLHSLGALIREELHMYIPSGAVNDGSAG